jgi:hypothetical protein
MTEHRFKIGQLVRYYAKWRVSIDTVSGLYQIIKRLPPADDGECQYARTAQSGRKRERVDARLKLCGTIRLPRGSEEGLSCINPWPRRSDEPCYSSGRELSWRRRDEAAAKSRIPMLIPSETFPAFPTFPETEPGRRRTGECGERGERYPLNDMVSSNVKRTTPGWSGRCAAQALRAARAAGVHIESKVTICCWKRLCRHSRASGLQCARATHVPFQGPRALWSAGHYTPTQLKLYGLDPCFQVRGRPVPRRFQ